MLCGAFFSGVALVTKRNHWALRQDEQDELGAAVQGIMPSISPGAAKMLSEASPWVRLALITGTIVSTRVAQDAAPSQRQPLRSVPMSNPAPRPPGAAPQRNNADVIFPAPPRAQEQPTAAQAAADLGGLPPIFAGEVPAPSEIVSMTSGGAIGNGEHTAPAFDVPGLHDTA